MKQKLVKIGHAIDIASPLVLDVHRLAETRLLAQASSGGGKSYMLRKLLEATHGTIQHVILDTEGEFSSLRKSFDYVYVAKGEATEPDPRSAAMLAQSLLRLGVSAIIDIYELHPRDRRKFVRHFLEALIDAPKNLWHPVLVVLDEAHEYAPEQSESEALDAVIALAAKGRKRDMACVLATQRPAKLNKDVAAECQNKLIGLANLDLDRKRAGDDLGFRSKDEILSLRALEPGEFYAVGPAFRLGSERIKEPVKIQCDQVETPHGRKARKWRPAKAASSKDVKTALAALAELPKQAEQELKDKESALARVRELEREARELRKGQPKKDPEAEKRAFEAGQAAERKVWAKMAMQIKGLKNKLTAKLQELGVIVNQIPDIDTPAGVVAHTYAADKPVSRPAPTPVPIRRPVASAATPPPDGEARLSKPARAMLNLLVAKDGESLTKAQLSGWTGYSISSSSFANALGELNSGGFINRNGDEVSLRADIADAIEALGPDYTTDIDFSIDGWLRDAKRLSLPARKMLELLKGAPGEVLQKDYLSEASGYSMTSSSFANGLGELCSKKLAVRTGGGIQINRDLLR